MDTAIEILQYLRKRLHFPDGLLVLLVFSEVLYYTAVHAIGHDIILLLDSVGRPKALNYCRVLYVLGFLLVPCIAFGFWRRLRAVPRFKKNELAIVFAPNSAPATQEVMERLFVNLTQEIKARELGIRFHLKRLPPNLSIDSAEEATGILLEARAVVAIWGAVEQQQSAEGRTTGFSKLSVTFVHRPVRIHPLRHEALAMSFAERQLHVRERTQIADQLLVAKDIGIVVRNVLGVALLIDLRHGEAAKILGPLHMDLQDVFPKKSSLPVQRFRMQVQHDFAFALTMATSDEYRKWLARDAIFDIPTDKLAAWLHNVEIAVSLDSQNSIHQLTKAIYMFISGDIQGAIKAEERADRLAPRAAATANLGLAFLYNFAGDLRRSRHQYRLGLAKKTSYDEDIINQCLSFISQSITRYPERKQLRLALGVLQYHRGSVYEAKQTLQALLDDPPTAPELQVFVEEARNLLNKVAVQQESERDA